MKRVKWIIILLIFLFSLSFISNSVRATQTYLNENKTWYQNLTNISSGTLVFGDIDNDGDLDLALSGVESLGAGIWHGKIFTNNGTSLVSNKTWYQNLTGVNYGSLMFGDIDNDGDLDLALTGCNRGADSVSQCTLGYDLTKIYENNGTSFRENKTWYQNLTAAYRSSTALGDIDNDGDLDLVLTGERRVDNSRIAKIYLNNGSSLVENTKWQQNLTGVSDSFLVLGDIDDDEDLDLILSGNDRNFDKVTKVYLNNGTSLVESKQWYTNIHAVNEGSLVLGDFDNDTDLDLSLTGCCDHHRIYQNNGTSLVEIQKEDPFAYDSLIGILESSQSLGDYDNDGDLDILTSGRERYTTLYLGYGNCTFNLSNQDPESIVKNLEKSSVVWNDLDNDTDLDLIIAGYEITRDYTLVYTNNITTPNTKPTPPKQFTNYTTEAGSIHLGWGNGSDTETPSNGLYYNIRVGYTSGGNDIISGKYGGGEDNGYFGNMMQRKNFTLKTTRLQTNTQYFWSVRTIDTGLRQSSWSSEQKFTTLGDLTPPVITLNAPINNYNSSSFNILFNATGYDNINITNMTLWGNWTGTWEANYTNSSGLNNSDYIFNINLGQEGDGYYKWAIRACDNSSLCSWSENRTFLVDTHYPNVSLMSPANDSTLSYSGISFKYNVTDKAIENCSLIIDSAVDQTDYTVNVGVEQSFSKILSNGNYRWSVNCTDSTNHTNNSKTRDFSIAVPVGGGISRGGVKERWIPECTRDRDCEGNERCIDNKCIRLFDIKIFGIDLPTVAGTFLKFSYLIKDMGGVNDDVRINFWLERNQKRVADGSEVVYLGAGEEKEIKSRLYLSPFLYGNYKFYVEILYNNINVTSHQLIYVERIKLEEFKESFIKSLKESNILRQIIGIIIILFVFGIIHFYIKSILKPKK